jgi:hypothetical protein
VIELHEPDAAFHQAAGEEALASSFPCGCINATRKGCATVFPFLMPIALPTVGCPAKLVQLLNSFRAAGA